MEVFWTFSIYLEAVALVPQMWLLAKCKDDDTHSWVTMEYLLPLGLYRGLYIFNWIYRFQYEGYYDPIAITAGFIQTGLTFAGCSTHVRRIVFGGLLKEKGSKPFLQVEVQQDGTLQEKVRHSENWVDEYYEEIWKI